MKTLEQALEEFKKGNHDQWLTLDAFRYGALRRLRPNQFAEIHRRNLAGENFDDMITKIALDWVNRKP